MMGSSWRPSRAPMLLSCIAGGAALSVVVDVPPGPVQLPPLRRQPTACSAPRTLGEAHEVLGRLLAPGLLAEFRAAAEGETATYNRTLGIWLRNSWGLWNGSPLRDHLRGLGLRHPDDMSALVLVTFWRLLNDRPLETGDEVKRLREADDSRALRFRPECRCFHIGRCTASRMADPTPGPPRAALVSGCCCGEMPQISEGRPVIDPETREVYVFADFFPVGESLCGPSFEATS